MTRALSLLALLLSTAVACESSESGESGAGSADDTTESGGSVDDPLDFPAVECGGVTCEAGWICVSPSEYCDYQLDPPAWVQPPRECAAVPASCADSTGYALDDCLWETLCESMGEPEYVSGIFLEGTLDCPGIGFDCFE